MSSSPPADEQIDAVARLLVRRLDELLANLPEHEFPLEESTVRRLERRRRRDDTPNG